MTSSRSTAVALVKNPTESKFSAVNTRNITQAHKYVSTRTLAFQDIPMLRALEIEKWGKEAATLNMLNQRIANAPGYSWGAFDIYGKKILASCFVMGVPAEKILASKSWYEVTNDGLAEAHDQNSKTWFGISLSGSQPRAVRNVLANVLCKMLLEGVKEVYLGSPIPGFHEWKKNNQNQNADDYIQTWKTTGKRSKHIDPLLEYYTHLGFQIVCAKPDYFPHTESDNYGVLIKYKNPIWFLSSIIRLVPRSFLEKRIFEYAEKFV